MLEWGNRGVEFKRRVNVFRNAFAILLFLSSLIPLRAQEVPFIPVFQGEELARHYLQIATLRAAWAVENVL